MQQIARGAEAILYKENKKLIKERIMKSYRIKEIDEKLRRRRTRIEANLIRKARSTGIKVPQILEEEEFKIKMEYIDGKRVKDILNNNNYAEICQEIGKSIALLHNFDIIHGDLTTSNMIIKYKKNIGIQEKSFDIYFIDFGLGFISKRIEDKATDLFLLHEALESTHFDIFKKAWKIILKAYSKNYVDAEKVINVLNKIEKRRRYK
ncbi:MAG: KEOPS complex kinase/ATPase Bud32 [Candidatus Aenigmatarchaeota archaeon]